MEFFNPSNAFDAEGLTRLTEQIERRKKQRNDVEQDTLIAIRNKNLEAEKLSLDIDRELEYARLAQQRELEIRRAHASAPISRAERAQASRKAERAQITSRETIEKARIRIEQTLEQERIARNAPCRAPRSSAACRWNWPSSSARSPWRANNRRRSRKRRPPPITRVRSR
jgi:uncharacterized membrane protein YqiK